MAVISISIIASEEQIVAGIPRKISIETNILASIFYTIDGSNPTLFSNIYTDPIFLPTDKLNITLKVMATNGIDNSPIITEIYSTNLASDTNARLPHSGTDAQAQTNLSSFYPFGGSPIQPNASFQNPADAGITVNNPDLPSVSNGFDGAGNPTAFTNQNFDTTNYNIKYSTTDKEGQTGYGIGNLPSNSEIISETPIPESSNMSDTMFDPRALVIFQDVSTENPNDPPHINRMHFSLENPEKSRDGNHFFVAGLDAPPTNGTFLRSHFNPRDNTITYYYLDTWTNRWIISTTPYTPNKDVGSMSGMVLSKQSGAGFIFEWLPFNRRVLF